MKIITRSALPFLAVFNMLALSGRALAHGADTRLHVGSAYDSCYFDLHPELTQRQFRTFASEAAAVGRFQQLAGSAGMGAGAWSFDLAETATPVDDGKGAWNNTFSHPEADHWLGDVQQIPRLAARYGVDDRLDVGAWGSVNPTSNFGLVGVDAKLTLLEARVWGLPLAVAVRPSLTSVLGPDEVWFGNAGVDLTAGLSVAGLSPYLGVGGTVGIAVETSDDVSLDTALAVDPVAVTGLVYRLGYVHVGAEATWSRVQTYGLVVGASI